MPTIIRCFVLLQLVACGGGSNIRADARGGGDDDADIADALPDAPVCVPLTVGTCSPTTPPTTPAAHGSTTCDPLAQTGCAVNEKCTWLVDSTSPTPLGHIGCAPNGDVEVGCACSKGAAGTTGYDDCSKGNVCVSGVCKTICGADGGAPTCGARYGCSVYAGLFDGTGTATAGACTPRCDPLGENDFLGSGHKADACVCGSAEGCYGFPGSSDQPTLFSCQSAFNTTLVNRSACTAADGCESSASSVYINGCAQGYEPLLDDMTGSSQAICVAMCAPGNTYLGNPGAQHPAGREPHACNTGGARGTFEPATTTTNGDHCFFSWAFEYDSEGDYVPSPTSNTVGFCVDHTKYTYDSNNNGMADGSDMVWPPCATLGIGSNVDGGFDAAYFGCVDTTTATANGSPPVARRARVSLRLPFHAIAK